jgi:hypothetical protein
MAAQIWLAAIALPAAVVNGALGHGFSTITVPLALIVTSNRVLNPALVLVEVGLNAWLVAVHRRSVRGVSRRVLPVIAGLVPGTLLGTLIVAHLEPTWLKLATYAVLLPLILLQTAGVRRPITREHLAGPLLGAGVGTMYAATTISGPPLALALNNQGLDPDAFRTAIGLIRVAESTLTASAYWYAGLYAAESLSLAVAMIPGLAVGVPLGAWLLRRVHPETFRRICMGVDTLVVGLGLVVVLERLALVSATGALALFAGIVALDGALLRRYLAGLTTRVDRAPGRR